MKQRPLDRFWSHVQMDWPDEHWLWTGASNTSGYAEFFDGGAVLAHRWAWGFYRGAIPDGMQIDHLCRVRHCVNPDHLEPVTQSENLLRGHAALRELRAEMASA